MVELDLREELAVIGGCIGESIGIFALILYILGQSVRAEIIPMILISTLILFYMHNASEFASDMMDDVDEIIGKIMMKLKEIG